jgi:hypothetical protein
MTTATAVNDPSPGFDRLWVDEDGVQHARGWIIPATVVDEGGGNQVSFIDWNIDLATGNGDFHGTVVRNWTVKGTTGTFEGRFDGTIEGFLFQGTVSSQGSGGFDGMKYKGVFTGVWGEGVVGETGVILDPKGEF